MAAEHREPSLRGHVEPDKALVYVINATKRWNMGMKVSDFGPVYYDDVYLGTPAGDEYTFTYLPPGRHFIWLKDYHFPETRAAESWDFEGGKEYFVVIRVSAKYGDTLLLDLDDGGQEFLDQYKHVTPSKSQLGKYSASAPRMFKESNSLYFAGFSYGSGIAIARSANEALDAGDRSKAAELFRQAATKYDDAASRFDRALKKIRRNMVLGMIAIGVNNTLAPYVAQNTADYNAKMNSFLSGGKVRKGYGVAILYSWDRSSVIDEMRTITEVRDEAIRSAVVCRQGADCLTAGSEDCRE